MSDANLLAEQREACLRRLDETAGRIRALLLEDLAGYPEREMRRRFVADPVRAETISDGGLVALRKAAVAAGAELVEALGAEFAVEALWRQAAGPLPSTRDLREVGHIWQVLAGLDERVETLAEAHGLGGDDREPAGYAPPARFIGGQHLPTLVEAYVRELATLSRLSEEATEVAERKQQQSLSSRWAKAGADG